MSHEQECPIVDVIETVYEVVVTNEVRRPQTGLHPSDKYRSILFMSHEHTLLQECPIVDAIVQL